MVEDDVFVLCANTGKRVLMSGLRVATRSCISKSSDISRVGQRGLKTSMKSFFVLYRGLIQALRSASSHCRHSSELDCQRGLNSTVQRGNVSAMRFQNFTFG
jgi:hypothetical protein